MVQWLRVQAPNAGGLGLIPDQGTRSHMPKLKIEDPVCHYSQINKLNFKSVKQPRPPPETAEERALSGG